MIIDDDETFGPDPATSVAIGDTVVDCVVIVTLFPSKEFIIPGFKLVVPVILVGNCTDIIFEEVICGVDDLTFVIAFTAETFCDCPCCPFKIAAICCGVTVTVVPLPEDEEEAFGVIARRNVNVCGGAPPLPGTCARTNAYCVAVVDDEVVDVLLAEIFKDCCNTDDEEDTDGVVVFGLFTTDFS